MKTQRPSLSSPAGFSLLEMLVAMALIGVLAAIMVAEISEVNGAGENAKAMRNAQNLASIYQSAQAAGVDFYDPDLGTIISRMVAGETLSDPQSPFHGATFSVPEMPPEDQLRAQFYLVLDPATQTIIYDVNAMP